MLLIVCIYLQIMSLKSESHCGGLRFYEGSLNMKSYLLEITVALQDLILLTNNHEPKCNIHANAIHLNKMKLA